MNRIFSLKLKKLPLKSKWLVLLCSLLSVAGCDHPENIKLENSPTSDAITAAVIHPLRPQLDIARDQIRAPHKVLEFFDVKQGEKIVEILAANGYYIELLSRCVGDTGKVYMQNNQKFYDFQTDKSVLNRLKDNRLSNVIRWDKELDDLQLETKSLDKVLMILVLHDLYWMEPDVDQVITGIFQSLKPGGILGIIDHAAEPGSGNTHAKEMRGIHRIDKQFVVKTMLQHGFLLEAESRALNHPEDDRSKAFFSAELKGKPTDRFMLRFKKPEQF